jgi:hypothetical protein
VAPWRERFDPSASGGLPAHVTILYPFAPPPDIHDETLRALTGLFAGFEGFDYTLMRTARFPQGVLYLEPEPAGPFVELVEAVWHLFPEHPPFEGAFDTVIPHVTVVDCPASDLCDDAGTTLADAERAVTPALPIRARAGEVWLMTKKERWTRARRFPLGGTA